MSLDIQTKQTLASMSWARLTWHIRVRDNPYISVKITVGNTDEVRYTYNQFTLCSIVCTNPIPNGGGVVALKTFWFSEAHKQHYIKMNQQMITTPIRKNTVLINNQRIEYTCCSNNPERPYAGTFSIFPDYIKLGQADTSTIKQHEEY